MSDRLTNGWLGKLPDKEKCQILHACQHQVGSRILSRRIIAGDRKIGSIELVQECGWRSPWASLSLG